MYEIFVEIQENSEAFMILVRELCESYVRYLYGLFIDSTSNICYLWS